MIRDNIYRGPLDAPMPMAGLGSGGALGQQSVPAQRPETPVESSLRSLEEQNKRLAVTVARLNDQLTPVLSSLDRPPNRGEGERPTSSAPLAEAILSQAEVMARQNNLLEEIISRLAI
jgi:hypothetical protein